MRGAGGHPPVRTTSRTKIATARTAHISCCPKEAGESPSCLAARMASSLTMALCSTCSSSQALCTESASVRVLCNSPSSRQIRSTILVSGTESQSASLSATATVLDSSVESDGAIFCIPGRSSTVPEAAPWPSAARGSARTALSIICAVGMEAGGGTLAARVLPTEITHKRQNSLDSTHKKWMNGAAVEGGRN